MSTSRLFSAFLICSLMVPGSSAQDRIKDVESILMNARSALGQPAEQPVLQISGRTERLGLPCGFRWTFAPEGFFMKETLGPFSQTLGYDGGSAWCFEGRAPAFAVDGLERDFICSLSWVISGAWCLERSPFEFSFVESEEKGQVLLDWFLKDGAATGQLTLDAQTHLPQLMQFDEASGSSKARFSDWKSESSPAMPWRITVGQPTADRVDFVIKDARIWDRAQPNYTEPQLPKGDSSYLEGVANALEVKRLPSGRVFVKPLIDGKDVGWFLLDPNLHWSMLRTEIGNDLFLGRFAETAFPGIGPIPKQISKFRQSHAMQLGPLLIDGQVFMETVDMGELDTELGEPCAGALGWDVFLRSVVEWDCASNTIALHNPSTFDGKALAWEPLIFLQRQPHLPIQLSGKRKGLQHLDMSLTSSTLYSSMPQIEWFQVFGEQVADFHAAPGSPRLGPALLPKSKLYFDYGSARLGL